MLTTVFWYSRLGAVRSTGRRSEAVFGMIFGRCCIFGHPAAALPQVRALSVSTASYRSKQHRMILRLCFFRDESAPTAQSSPILRSARPHRPPDACFAVPMPWLSRTPSARSCRSSARLLNSPPNSEKRAAPDCEPRAFRMSETCPRAARWRRRNVREGGVPAGSAISHRPARPVGFGCSCRPPYARARAVADRPNAGRGPAP